ncbi:DnaJ-like cysteine-rich domain-containing protein [Odoribacter lunatus]|uniref:DnaJ-like cysteine-rich domain-containing protein n=1 Tax=Odoribacter lunatus TaxID=2941335 RepID=UPI00203E2ABA|nr:hypothetical protein [Odoribacter lunatus]
MKKVYLKEIPGYAFSRNRIIEIPYTTDTQQNESITQIKEALLKEGNLLGKKQRHTINILDKIIRKTEIEQGQMLVSYYLNTYCKRDKDVFTQTINEEIPVINDAPENIDYCLDFLESYNDQYFREGLEGECRFSVVNKRQYEEPYVLCTNCNGEGKIKCPVCGGSGREQYTDGYYASGEKRIKTGHCSECQGYGKINCPECNGQGKIEIFAPHYSVVKSVKEVYLQRIVPTCKHTWRTHIGMCNDDTRLYKVFNNQETIRFLKKNRKEVIVDNSQQIIQEMEANKIRDYYEQNNKNAEKGFKMFGRFTSGSDLICQQEIHYLVPITRLKINIFEKDSMTIYLLPYDEESIYISLDKPEKLKGTGTLKYLFYKLFK